MYIYKDSWIVKQKHPIAYSEYSENINILGVGPTSI